MTRRKVLVLGAAGRDFHNFNTISRADPEHEVVAFTAAQIPNIADRRYRVSKAEPTGVRASSRNSAPDTRR